MLSPPVIMHELYVSIAIAVFVLLTFLTPSSVCAVCFVVQGRIYLDLNAGIATERLVTLYQTDCKKTLEISTHFYNIYNKNPCNLFVDETKRYFCSQWNLLYRGNGLAALNFSLLIFKDFFICAHVLFILYYYTCILYHKMYEKGNGFDYVMQVSLSPSRLSLSHDVLRARHVM